jgi:hypothetical protein
MEYMPRECSSGPVRAPCPMQWSEFPDVSLPFSRLLYILLLFNIYNLNNISLSGEETRFKALVFCGWIAISK